MRRFLKGLLTSQRQMPTSSVMSQLPKIKIGVCAMDKKAKSKPMREILGRLLRNGEFEVVYFGDAVILNNSVDEWPLCDCLLSWHSDGFPLHKAQAYASLRKPFLVNDVFFQDVLLDRRMVYGVLVEKNIPVPPHIIVDRSNLAAGQQEPEGFLEDEDYVEMHGTRIYKPFVEKPADGEDHNVYIYYPHSMGGGIKRLFRKVDDKSSQYDHSHPGTVRRGGSYLYEEFLPTGGTDVKVYTVGPRYAHAEARKSPVVDGKVLRTADGKEMRFPVLLSPQEKEIARMVCLAFGQKVCGFDLLRSESGKSYVCDVNGLSFVKNSKKYYDDAAGILRSIILSALAPHRLAVAPRLLSSQASLQPGMASPYSADVGLEPGGFEQTLSLVAEEEMLAEEEDEIDQDVPGVSEEEVLVTNNRSEHEELRCVLAVIRHGDRTPKQKLKIKVTAEPLLTLFQKYKDSKGKQAKLKSPQQLQELLDITGTLLTNLERQEEQEGGAGLSDEQRDTRNELREKLRIVRTVLEQRHVGGHFSGVNRKVQLKPVRWSVPTVSTGGAAPAANISTVSSTASLANLGKENNVSANSLSSLAATLGGPTGPPADTAPSLAAQSSCSDGGVASTPTGSSASAAPVLEEALMILKWGGVLTHAGRQQAEDLGRVFRLVMYPRTPGGGLLRLHSTYRHDLKIYSSDEGRVQTSAAAFTQGLLDLEGTSLTPILVSLVKKDASMLDAFGKGASDEIRDVKNRLYSAMTWDPEKDRGGFTPLVANTPTMLSPSLSPRSMSRNSSMTAGDRLAYSQQAVLVHQAGKWPPPLAPAAAPPRAPSPAIGAGTQLAPPLAAGTLAPPPLAAENSGGTQAAKDSVGQAAAQSASQAYAGEVCDANSSYGAAPNHPYAGSSVIGSLLLDGPASPTHLAGAPTDPSGGTAAHPLPRSVAPLGLEKLALPQDPVGPVAGGARPTSAAVATPSLCPLPTLPTEPLKLLKRLVELMKLTVAELRQLCLKEGNAPSSSQAAKYSSLSQAHDEWELEPDRPCSGERMLLMFDRWSKLLRSFYNEKKDRYDISKVPDIYDSAKHDAIHNKHLRLSQLEDLYRTAKVLADAVIPNEYGLDPVGKLRIGSKIASELLGKLLVDLASMREESVATASMEAPASEPYDRVDSEVGKVSLQDEAMIKPRRAPSIARESWTGTPSPVHGLAAAPGSHPLSPAEAGDSCQGGATPGTPLPRGVTFATEPVTPGPACGAASGGTPNVDGEHGGHIDAEDFEGDAEHETIHRLAPAYAADINSPLRHVRTRIYFTSESHIHSLVNVLRYCHLQPSSQGGTASSAAAAQQQYQNQQHAAAAAAAAATAGGTVAGPSAAGSRAASEGGGASGAVPPTSPALASHPRCPADSPAGQARPLLRTEGLAFLDTLTELDYLTHVVFRMYENKAVPVEDPERFRVEVLFSPGTSYAPVGEPEMAKDHVLPVFPRKQLQDGEGGLTLAQAEQLLLPFAQTRKFAPASYALQFSLRAPNLVGAAGAAATGGLTSPAGPSRLGLAGPVQPPSQQASRDEASAGQSSQQA